MSVVRLHFRSVIVDVLAFIQARVVVGAPSVMQDEVFAAVVPPNRPEFRLRSPYRAVCGRASSVIVTVLAPMRVTA